MRYPNIAICAIVTVGKVCRVLRRAAREEGKERKGVVTMTGMYFGAFFSLLIIMLVATVLFIYTWLQSHGVGHTSHGHLDLTAGDEGED